MGTVCANGHCVSEWVLCGRMGTIMSEWALCGRMGTVWANVHCMGEWVLCERMGIPCGRMGIVWANEHCVGEWALCGRMDTVWANGHCVGEWAPGTHVVIWTDTKHCSLWLSELTRPNSDFVLLLCYGWTLHNQLLLWTYLGFGPTSDVSHELVASTVRPTPVASEHETPSAVFNTTEKSILLVTGCTAKLNRMQIVMSGIIKCIAIVYQQTTSRL